MKQQQQKQKPLIETNLMFSVQLKGNKTTKEEESFQFLKEMFNQTFIHAADQWASMFCK